MVRPTIARALTLATAGTLAACSPPSRSPDDDTAANAALGAEAAAVINLQDATEIEALKARVIALEREVGEMKANPQALDLELLTQRVQRLEAGTVDSTPSPAEPTPAKPSGDAEGAQRAVDAALAERRARREPRE